MRRLDELHLQWPFLGSRMLRDKLRLEGISVGRKHVATLMLSIPSIVVSDSRPSWTVPRCRRRPPPILLSCPR
jgi:putative transposase